MINQNYGKFYKKILTLLKFKTMEIKSVIPEITIDDVAFYFLSFKIRNEVISNINQVTNLILSISVNKLIEYLNIRETTNKNNTLNNFKGMF